MNKTIEAFTRQQIKDGLAKLPAKNVMVFKLMYSHTDLEMPVNDAVDAIPADRLNWALTQIENTLRKFAQEAAFWEGLCECCKRDEDDEAVGDAWNESAAKKALGVKC